MKKSVFTLLAIATAVFTMSSCSQNDGGNSNDLNLQQPTSVTADNSNQSQANVEKNYYAAKVALDSTLLNMGTYTLTVQDGEKTQTYVINTSAKPAKVCGYVGGEINGSSNGISAYGVIAGNRGAEFNFGFTSTSKNVKFSLSFQPNANFQVGDETKERSLIANIQYVNVASEQDVKWDQAGQYYHVDPSQYMATAQKIADNATKSFTK